MTSIIWTYLWVSVNSVAVVVRLLVLRRNLRDWGLLKSPQVNASPLMLRIQKGHMRLSILLALVSVLFFVVGVDALITRYDKHFLSSLIQNSVGYSLLVTIIAQSAILTLLAWHDLRIRVGK